MSLRDYQTLHLDNLSNGTALLLLSCISMSQKVIQQRAKLLP